MIFAGRLQDEIGPRATTFFGGVLSAWASCWWRLATSYAAWFVGFGVFGGLGLGVIYATTTPTALRWVPAIADRPDRGRRRRGPPVWPRSR